MAATPAASCQWPLRVCGGMSRPATARLAKGQHAARDQQGQHGHAEQAGVEVAHQAQVVAGDGGRQVQQMGGCQRGQQQGHAVVAFVARQPDRAPQRRRAPQEEHQIGARQQEGRTAGNQVAARAPATPGTARPARCRAAVRPVQLAPAVSKPTAMVATKPTASRARARPARSIRRAAEARGPRAAPRSRPRHSRQGTAGGNPFREGAPLRAGPGGRADRFVDGKQAAHGGHAPCACAWNRQGRLLRCISNAY